MCGIAGWWGWLLPESERVARLRAMCNAIVHRGPDDAGFHVTDDVALGMRRLSIVDLAGGRQPMSSEDGRYTLVFNGEIFNHEALRRELEAQGHVFRSRSDTEVLLRLFVQAGFAGLERCNGMFAIALWDAREKALHLARDRMGVKPLVYAWDGKRLLFASEAKAVFASGGLSPVVNSRGLWDYLTFRYVPGPDSIWQGLFKLPPGCRLRITPGMAAPEIIRYWDIPYRTPPREESEALFDEQFEALLDDATHLRTLADVPVGILLSGGLDSSTVAALAVRHAGAPVKTFSVAFGDAAAIDERPFARMAAARLGTDHYEVVLDLKTFRDSLDDIVYFSDEPLADLACVPLLHVCRLARQHVKVVLSGEGSDEVLGGYDLELYARRWREGRPPGLRGMLDPFSRGHWPDMRRWPTPFNMTNYLSSKEKRSLMREGAPWPDSFDKLRDGLRSLGKQDLLHQTLYTFCQDWLVEDLLMKADRMSMAASVELRTPFLDYRLVEWAAGIAPEQKAGPDARGVWTSKRILRRLATGLLPPEIIDRPKMGFPVPVYDWLCGPLRDFAHDLLGPGRRVDRWLRPSGVDALLARGIAEDAPILDRHRLWNVLILEIWAQRWKA